MEKDRNPMNLQGLLRFALNYTKSEDPTHASTYDQMDEERKQFLECALNSLTVDVIVELEKAIVILENSSSSSEEKLDALNNIREFIDNMDFANNFVKVGGTKMLLEHMKNENIQIRVASIYIVAEMAQNNPFCQKHFIDENVLPILMPYLKEKNEEVSSSALHAISSLVRSFEPGLVKFFELGGIKLLLSCLSTDYPRLFVKTCFLIACLSSSHAAVRDELVKKTAIIKLFQSLEPITGFDIKIESCLFALSELSKSKGEHPQIPNLESCINVLKSIIDQNRDLPQSEEIVNYAKTVLENLEDVENTG